MAGGKAGVVPQVGSLRLGDVKVSCGLRDETPSVGWDEVGKLVQKPSVGQACGEQRKEQTARIASVLSDGIKPNRLFSSPETAPWMALIFSPCLVLSPLSCFMESELKKYRFPKIPPETKERVPCLGAARSVPSLPLALAPLPLPG